MMTPRQHERPKRPEDRRFLEALCFWRALYALRGPQDTIVVCTVAEAVDGAEERIRIQRVVNEHLLRRFTSG